MYLCDNEIFFLDLNTDKIISSKFKSLKEDQIIDSELFSDEFFKFLTKNHIKTTIFGQNICIIKNAKTNGIIIEKYKEILDDYFRYIEFKDLETILNIDNDNGYLNISNNYIDYYFMKKNEKNSLRINLVIFNNNLNKTIQHLFTNIYKPKKLTIFGKHDNISKLAENINKDYNILTIFPEFHYNFILEKYKK